MSINDNKNNSQQPTNPAISDALQRAQQAQQRTAAPEFDALQRAQQAQQRTAAPEFDAAAAGQAQQQRNPFNGMASLNSIFARPLSRNGVGEHTMAYVESMQNFLRAGMQGENNFAVIPVDRSSFDLSLSVIVVTAKYVFQNKPTLLSYALVLEPNDGPMDVRLIREGNQELEIPSVPSDAYDARTKDAVAYTVGQHFGLTDVGVIEVGYSVIPSDLDPKDDHRLARIVTNAVNAIDGTVKEQPGFAEKRFNVGLIRGSSVRVTGRMDFAPAPVETLAGLPVRNDITITTRMVTSGDQQNGVSSTSRVLTQVGGFIDLHYIEPQLEQGQYGQFRRSNCYLPNFVITNQNIETNAITPELSLFALASSRLLNTNQAYLNAFRPRQIKNDTRDIGGIGYEANLTGDPNFVGAVIDTNDASFNLQQIAHSAFLPGLLYSIDIEEGGDQSWVYTALQYAAEGEPEAVAAIVQAANNLTNGKFGQLWNGGEIVRHSGNLVHLGYYFSPEGVKEDLRQIDYLAMLNLTGHNGLSDVIAWSSTFDNMNESPLRRLANRTRLIQGLIHQNAHFKNYAHRYILDGHFLDTLANAIAAAGLVINPEAMFSDFQPASRGNLALAASAVQGGVSNLFNNPMASAQTTGNWNMAPRTGGRFGNL